MTRYRIAAQALDYLIAMLAIDPWVGLVGSGGERCRTCWGLYPDHNENCPRKAAQDWIDELQGGV